MNQKTNWKTKLEKLSLIIHKQMEDNFICYNKLEISNNWIGFEPANEDEIIKTEEKLKTNLPKSYIFKNKQWISANFTLFRRLNSLKYNRL